MAKIEMKNSVVIMFMFMLVLAQAQEYPPSSNIQPNGFGRIFRCGSKCALKCGLKLGNPILYGSCVVACVAKCKKIPLNIAYDCLTTRCDLPKPINMDTGMKTFFCSFINKICYHENLMFFYHVK